MLDSWVWFKAGKERALELRFACQVQTVKFLCIGLSTSHLLFKQIDVIKGRSVFSTLGWSAEPPLDLGELVGWLVAGGPLSKVPVAAGAGGSSHA